MDMQDNKRVNWGSRLSFILVSAGATIGFGNIWRFPYLVGQNGGGAFLFLFLLCILTIGIPLLVAEMVIGRRRSANAIDAFIIESKHSNRWKFIGYLAALGAFSIMAYYTVLAGWVMAYAYFVATGELALGTEVARSSYRVFFTEFIQNPLEVLAFTALFMLVNHLILAFDIRKGIEKVANKLMPVLFLIILVMIARAVTLEGAMEGVIFYLKPDLSKINFSTLLLALGQTFFSLSIGFGVLITLSSYLDKKTNLLSSAVWIVSLDTLVAVLAGFILFPSIFAFGLDPAAGTSLIFEALPIVFSQMWMGRIFTCLFFSILIIAALTTSLTIFEVLIAILVEKLKISRKNGSRIVLVTVFLLGSIPSALSESTFNHVRILGKNIFDFYDYFSGNILFVSTAFLMTLFIGWVIPKQALEELKTSQEHTNPFWIKSWFFLIRYIIPWIILVIFLKGLSDNLA